MKVTLFLGAGFSRAWNLPVMSEFFNVASDSRRLGPPEKAFLTELQKCARTGASFLDIRHGNLEDILSFCLMAGTLGRAKAPEGLSRHDRFCEILSKVYSNLEEDAFVQGSRNLSALEQLIQPSESGVELSIITTNYDLVAETSFYVLSKGTRLPFVFEPSVDPSQDRHPRLYANGSDRVPLCKLHGSLNWYGTSSKDGSAIIVEDRLGRYRNLRSESRGDMFTLPLASSTDYRHPCTPLIVPPSLFKWETDGRFQASWQCAGEALQNANRVVFIGYSFPESDTYMKYFLAANLHANVQLRQIDIIDPDADAICGRLRLSNYGSVFKQMLRPVPDRWQDAMSQKIFTIRP
jgi:hypothetical protein